MKSFRINRFFALILFTACISLVAFISPKGKAEAAADFYKGKTIHWVVSSSPGSTTTLLSRIAAQYLGEKIGAKVKVENMGRNKGLNYVFTRAKPDGLTLVSKARTAVVLNDLAKAPGIRYKAAEFTYITDLMVEASAMFTKPGSKYADLETIRQAKGLKAGGTSARGFFATAASVMFEIMGVDGKVIPGYKGPPKLVLALGQGEVDVITWQAAASLKKIKDGSIKPIFVIGDQRFPAMPDVPTFRELGGRIPDALADAYQLISWSGQAVMGPPGVPSTKLGFLRDTFQQLGKNPNLQNDIKKAVGYYSPFEQGEKMQANIEKILSSKALSSQLKGIVDKYTAAR
jgi:tripartite-type tricarboxylate transporter receptor subunit TctC